MNQSAQLLNTDGVTSLTAVTVRQEWSHQPPAIEWLCSRPASLLDAWMGTGKTYIAIQAIRRIAVNKSDVVLVVCPCAVLGVWRREFEKHAAGQYRVLILDDRMNSAAKGKAVLDEMFRNAVADKPLVIVVNFESMIRDQVLKVLMNIRYAAMIVDESHRIKGYRTASSKACWKIGKNARFRFALTGTVMPQNPGDIFAQMRYLDDRVFGSYWTKFLRRHAEMNRYIPQKVEKWVNVDEIRHKIRPYIHTISRDVLVLPPRQMIEVPVTLSPSGMKHYREMRTSAYTELRKVIQAEGESIADVSTAFAANSAVKFLRLLQLAQGYVRDENSEDHDTDTAKRRALLDLLESTDEPVCVYGHFSKDMRVVEDCCLILGRRYGEISGRRKDLTQHATMPEDVDVMAVQCKSGSAGIDLTRSRIGIIINSGLLSPGDYDQMLSRQYRPGQSKDVVFYSLIAQGTVDVTIQRAREMKRDVVKEIMMFDVMGDEHSKNTGGK